MNFKNTDAFFFDLDGTLIDSKLNFIAMRDDLGIGLDIDILEYIDSLKGERRKEAENIVHRHEEEGARVSTIIAGVKTLINYFEEQLLPFGILTRNSRTCSEIMLQMHNLKTSRLVCREDAPPKPRPDGLLSLCEYFGVKPERALYVGDYIHDLNSAKNAGMPAVLYNNHKNDEFIKDADFSFSCYESFLKKIRNDKQHER